MLFSNLFPPKDLWAAAKRGDVLAIERLFRSGHDINAKKRTLSVEGATPLHVAAETGQWKAVQKLAELGARIDAKDDAGTTALMVAVSGHHEAVVHLLIELGAKPGVQNRAGQSALDLAAFEGLEELVAKLLRMGAGAGVGNGRSRSAPIGWAVHGGKLSILELLIQFGADVNVPCALGFPLSLAALERRIDIARFLLDNGADPNHQDQPPSGYTVLMSAVAGGELEIVDLLVTRGASINDLNPCINQTALDLAESRSRTSIASFLRAHGAKRATEA